jgi:hypothetical protein
MLNQESWAVGLAARSPLAPKAPHHTPKAKACIFLSMLGGVSQADTFDPKPALRKFDNTVMDWTKERATDQPNLFAKPRLILGSPWEFKKYGQCGMDVSDLFPHLATCVDDMAFVRSVQTESGNHPAAVFAMNTGSPFPGHPSVGAWTTFGLGSENQNLPAFAVLPDFRSVPFSGSQQWGSGFLPSSYQGTVLRWKGQPIRDLKPPGTITAEAQARQMDLLRSYNQEYMQNHFTNPDLQGRLDAYELAYRMQAEAPQTLDVDSESVDVKAQYGLNDSVTESFGRRCLMARRLVERGVRFVQIYTPSQSWDGHTDILKNHTKNAKADGPAHGGAAEDLKQRGLLTAHTGGVDGRIRRERPIAHPMRDKAGRDHSTRAMTMWFAGGGTKGGALVGGTDDLGFKAVSDVYRMRDVHATVLHLMGLNDLQLTFYNAGRNMRLTDTGGKVIQEVIA